METSVLESPYFYKKRINMADPTYQWYEDSILIVGATSKTFDYSSTDSTMPHSVYCIATTTEDVEGSKTIKSKNKIININPLALHITSTLDITPEMAGGNVTVTAELSGADISDVDLVWMFNEKPGNRHPDNDGDYGWAEDTPSASPSSGSLTTQLWCDKGTAESPPWDAGNGLIIVGTHKITGEVFSSPEVVVKNTAPKGLTITVDPSEGESGADTSFTYSSKALNFEPTSLEWQYKLDTGSYKVLKEFTGSSGTASVKLPTVSDNASYYVRCVADGVESNPVMVVVKANSVDQEVVDGRAKVAFLGDSFVDYSDYNDTNKDDALDAEYAIRGLATAFTSFSDIGLQQLDHGVGGETLAQIAARKEEVPADAKLVVLIGGTNDIVLDPTSFDATVSAASVDEIVKHFAPKKVLILDQITTGGGGAYSSQAAELNKEVDKVIAANDNAYRISLNHFSPDDASLINNKDWTHPAGKGSLLLGQDINDELRKHLKSTWTKTDLTVTDLNGAQEAVDASTGSTGTKPTGWDAAGKGEFGLGHAPGWAKITYTGDASDAEYATLICDPVWTNNTGAPVKVMATCKAQGKFSGEEGYDWGQDHSDTGIFSLHTDISSTYNKIGHNGDINSNIVPECLLRTGVIEVVDGGSVSAEFALSRGTSGDLVSPEFEFSDISLFIVDDYV